VSRLGAVLRQPLRVQLPWQRSVDHPEVAVPVDVLRRPAAVVAWVVPVVMMIVGIAIAIPAAFAAETDRGEGVGSLGTELGAALWFGGAVAWGARRRATVARIVLLAGVFVVGMALIAIALVRDWSGAGLALAMEFGVGLVAVAVIDVVLIGVVDNLSSFSRQPDGRTVVVRLGQSWHLVDVVRPVRFSPSDVPEG
jgi:hypothetical protein